jgi:hypothetical protein
MGIIIGRFKFGGIILVYEGADAEVIFPPFLHSCRNFGADNGVDAAYLIAYLPGYLKKEPAF